MFFAIFIPIPIIFTSTIITINCLKSRKRPSKVKCNTISSSLTYSDSTQSWQSISEKEYLMISEINWKTNKYQKASSVVLPEPYKSLAPGIFPMFTVNENEAGAFSFIEIKFKKKEGGSAGLYITGNVDITMTDSIRVAYEFTKDFLGENGLRSISDKNAFVNIVPAQVKKEGSSAGGAFVTAFLSAALGIKPKSKTAVFGEIGSFGNLIDVKGLEQKSSMAKQLGYKTLIMPDAMSSDWEKLSEEHKNGLETEFVLTYSQVFGKIFPTMKMKKNI